MPHSASGIFEKHHSGEETSFGAVPYFKEASLQSQSFGGAVARGTELVCVGAQVLNMQGHSKRLCSYWWGLLPSSGAQTGVFAESKHLRVICNLGFVVLLFSELQTRQNQAN